MIVRGEWGGWRGLDLPAVVGVDEGCGGGAVAGEIGLHLGKAFWVSAACAQPGAPEKLYW